MQFVVDSKIAMNLVGIKQRLERSSDDGGMNTDFDAFAYFRGCLQKKTNHKCYTLYTVLTNFTDDGYDYYIAINQNEPLWMDYQVQLSPEKANEFELIAIPEGQYLVCITSCLRDPVDELNNMRRRAVTEWFSSANYELRDAPEIGVIHWPQTKENISINHFGYCELWLPIIEKTRA